MLNGPDRQSKRLVQGAHPLGITLGEIIVDRDDMDAFTDETVEIHGQRGYQGFPLASFHLGDFPLVQHDATNELHIKMPHIQQASRYLTHDSKSVRNEAL